MKELKLIPPTDPRVQCAIAPFNNDMLKDEGFKDRKELSETMFDTMKKYGGNQKNKRKHFKKQSRCI